MPPLITIDKESKQRKLLPIDVDHMSPRYKTENGYFSFPSPSLWTIEKNLFYLLRNSRQVIFDRRYKMRPDYLSFDEYGTVALAHLLMYVNNIFSPEDFELDNVIIPDYSAILDICQDRYANRTDDEMIEVNW